MDANVLKVAEHSFAHALADSMLRARKDCTEINMVSIQKSFYMLNSSAICTIFPHNWTKCFDGFSLL